jgi:dipeptidyl aminopeptidase/acylaminoacyl peptidase
VQLRCADDGFTMGPQTGPHQAGDLSLRFWGAERLVLQQPGRWQVRSWPGWRLLEAGSGTAVVEPGGDRLAVAAPDGTIRAGGPAAHRLPRAAGRLTGLAWSGGSLLVAARAAGGPGRADLAGAWARPIGAPPTERASLWRLPLDGRPPTWLYDAPPGGRVWAVHDLGGEVLVEHYPSGELRRPPAAPRLVVVADDGQSRDLAPELPGGCCDATVAPDGRVAFLHGAFPHSELVFPTWFALVEGRQGRWRRLLPAELRWGPPTWAADGSRLVVAARQGIRQGVVIVDPASGRWQWCALETAASYRSPAMAAAGGEVVALRQPLAGQPAIVAVRGRHRRVLQPLGEPVTARHRWRIHTWQAPEGALEGILGTPTSGNGPWPLVVDLHAGPQGGLVAGDPDHLAHLGAWCEHGFAAFAPDFRGSGILGRDAMLAALQGDGLPDDDREAHDVLSGVESLLATGLADPGRLFLFGHSYGAYLLNRIVTVEHRFAAAVCWEGVADLRLLDALQGGSAAQRAWRGGSPLEVPERWAAAAPAARADRVHTPLLLVYGSDGIGPTHGVAWLVVLRDHGVPCELVVYDGEGHLFSRPENTADMFARAAAWFRRHQASPR